MNWRKSLISIVAVIVLFATTFAIYYALSSFGKTPEEKIREEANFFVKTKSVSYTSNSSKIIETGRLTSQQNVDLSVEVPGQIIAGDVTLREGSGFKKGDLLIRVFDEEARNNLKASKSRFMNSIAGILPDIKIDYSESFTKYLEFFNSIKITKPLPPLPDPDSEQEKVFLASRNILNEYYSIKSAEVRLSRYRIYAPFDGTFTAVYLEPGSVANPGSRIASMIRTDKLEVEVPVRIEDAYWINVGDKVKLSTKDHHVSWNGYVVRKSNFMDPSSQAIAVYVSIAHEKDQPLFPGQYLIAEFASKTLEGTMAIPRNAVFDKDKVFTVEDGKLVENTINVIKTNETTVFFSGLDDGVEIVVEPLVNAKEGAKAEILKAS